MSHQPDHLKHFSHFLVHEFRSQKNPLPALAHETPFLVQKISNFKILTKFDVYGRPEAGFSS